MCTLISPNLLCTYVHIKPKLILFNIVAPPASYANINSLSTKPMFKTFHLEPIQVVLCIKLGLWVHWWGLLHLPNYCAHMCTIIFHRGLEPYYSGFGPLWGTKTNLTKSPFFLSPQRPNHDGRIVMAFPPMIQHHQRNGGRRATVW